MVPKTVLAKLQLHIVKARGGGHPYFGVQKQVKLIRKCFTTRCQRFLPFVNISLGAQDMIRQSSAVLAKMSDFPIHPLLKNHAQNEH